MTNESICCYANKLDNNFLNLHLYGFYSIMLQISKFHLILAADQSYNVLAYFLLTLKFCRLLIKIQSVKC